MKKYKIMTVKKAAQKGLLKEGDEIWVKVKVYEIHDSDMTEYPLHICGYGFGNWIHDSFSIRIPIPEPKPIDFSVAGRVLVNKQNNLLICTTGYFDGNHFSGYLLKDTESYKKGYCFNSWSANNWQDITDTYKP